MNDSPHSVKKFPRGVFVATTVFIFFLSLAAANSVGFVPFYVDGTQPSRIALSELPMLGESPETAGAAPARIVIPAIGVDLPVQNPQTRDIATLDVILERGPARYMDSAMLGEAGNALIFAHSSHLPIVRNKMFQAFNRISDLAPGAVITMESEDGTQYLYAVASVRKVDARDATIDLSRAGPRRLTLVTCNTLAEKSARFVLEATFVGITAISQ